VSDQRRNMERMEARFRGNGGQFLCPAGFPVPEDTKEWVVVKGDKGEKGDQGDQGERGLPRGQARAIVYLFIIAFLVASASLLYITHVVSQNNVKWCTTITLLVSEKPPPGPAAANPSRAYEQRLYADLTKLRHDLGCG
jgi:hypothetical protein